MDAKRSSAVLSLSMASLTRAYEQYMPESARHAVDPAVSRLSLALARVTVMNAFLFLVGGVFLLQAGRMLYRRYLHPLRDVPGPFLGSMTNLWYFESTLNGRDENLTVALHKKYGKYVRVAPNTIQTSDPASLDDIYSARANFRKSEFYALFDPHISSRSDIFTETDEKKHARRRRDVAGLYTPGAILEYEPRIAGLVELFCQRLESAEGPLDLATLCRRYTFDVIGEMFYGKDGGFGFMRDNIDYNSWMHMLDVMLPPGSSVSYLPSWARAPFFTVGMLFAETREAVRGFSKVVQDAKTAVKQRIDELAAPDGAAPASKPRSDILSKLLDLSRARGEKLDFHVKDIETEIWMMIWSGADTTAYALAAVFYYLLTSPAALRKLQAELDGAFAAGKLSDPARYSDGVKLPYLNACVMDAMRLHPSVGLMLPRDVPAGGALVGGRFLPGGTTIGIQASAMHRDTDAFGADAAQFVPERWLRDGEEKAAQMERRMLMWGAGTHTCIGRQIVMLEMYKLLPTVLRRYDFALETPKWKVWTGWFHRVENVLVTVKKR